MKSRMFKCFDSKPKTLFTAESAEKILVYEIIFIISYRYVSRYD